MTKRERLRFKSANQMIAWMMENEGSQIVDSYGRIWSYQDYTFWFKDIGLNAEFQKNHVDCLHLYGTDLHTFK